MSESKNKAQPATAYRRLQRVGQTGPTRWTARALTFGLGSLAVFCASPVGAADVVVPETREEAARLNSRGIELYKKQQYAPAVEQLSAAYRLDPDPSILCNLARAQYKLQPGAVAADQLEKCLASDGTLSDTSRQTLEGYLKDARQRAVSEAAEPAPAPLLQSPAPESPTQPPPSRPLWRLAVGGGLSALGAGLIIAGGAAWSLHGQCATPDPPCEFIYKTEPGGAAAVAIGSAALVGGIVLLAWPPPRPRTASK